MEFIKKIIRPYRIRYVHKKKRERFQRAIANAKNLNIVVGSAGICEAGWIPTEEYFLNILDDKDWYSYFKEGSVDNILAEHVWEHLTIDEGKKAAETCHKFLKRTGRLRIAVPDGFHSNRDYIECVKVNGRGRGAHDHKVLYNYRLLGDLLKSVGFSIDLLEYFDECKKFHAKKWNAEDGYVYRSAYNDREDPDGILDYTSLIVDAIKS